MCKELVILVLRICSVMVYMFDTDCVFVTIFVFLMNLSHITHIYEKNGNFFCIGYADIVHCYFSFAHEGWYCLFVSNFL